MSDPQLQSKMEDWAARDASELGKHNRLKYLLAKKDILEEVQTLAKSMNLKHTSSQDYYDAWRDLFQENELAIGIEERRAAGGSDEV